MDWHVTLLFLWLFPSCRVAGITDDLSSPHRPVRLLARSQSSTFQISLTRVFPSCFRSSSLPFHWYIRPQHFPPYVFAISPHHMPVPVQSSLGDLFGSLRHLVVPRMCSFLILSLRVTPHIHRSILISVTSIRFSCLFVVAHVSAPYSIAGLITVLYTFPFSFTGILLSHSTPLPFFQFLQPAPTRFVISVSIPPSSSILVPRYLKWVTLSSISPSIFTGSRFPCWLFKIEIHKLSFRPANPHSSLFQRFSPRIQILSHVYF